MKKVLIVLLVIILGAVAYGLARSGWFESWQGKGGTTNENLSPTNQLASLKYYSKDLASFPEASSEQEVAFSALPVKVQALFPAKDKTYAAKTLVFANGSHGFGVEYASSESVLVEYSNFLDNWYAQRDFTGNSSSRMENAALAILDGNTYRVKAEFLEATDHSVSAKVVIVQK